MKMRDFGNDLAHIAFACLILGLPQVAWWGLYPLGICPGLAD